MDRYVPASARTLAAHPVSDCTCRSSKSEKNECPAMMSSSDSIMSRAPYGLNFLGNIDPHRTPGDTAPTAYAARGAELVDPGSYFVRQPLAVSSLPRRPHAAAVDIGVTECEAGVPSPPSFGMVSGHVGH